MAGIKKYTNIESLLSVEDRNYQGYYWLSNSKNPIMVNGSFEPQLKGNNPFIIEAMLFDKEKNISVMIIHTGDYQIIEYDMNYLINRNNKIENINYMAHRLVKNNNDKFNKVKFQQLWVPEEDALCANMKVLKLKASIFCGFE